MGVLSGDPPVRETESEASGAPVGRVYTPGSVQGALPASRTRRAPPAAGRAAAPHLAGARLLPAETPGSSQKFALPPS